MLPFLEPDEVVQLTGKVRRSAQAAALQMMAIEHKVRPDGSIAVLRSHVEKVFGGNVSPKTERKIEPNWSAINA